MTISELLDNVARQADDDSTTFRDSARRWLNLVRSYAASRARWRGAVRVDHFKTVAARTDGLYTLPGYEHLVEDTLYDQTNINVIVHESDQGLNAADVQKQSTGQPAWWSDAGTDAVGDRMIYLWPVPSAVYVIRFSGQARLVDLTADDDEVETDPFFGHLAPWSAVFAAGLRYYLLDDQNDDASQTLTQLRIFDRMIDGKKGTNKVAPVSSTVLMNVRQRTIGGVKGRLDPGHFSNRGR